MSRLDRYVTRIVLGALCAAELFFLFLAILVDLLNRLPKYAEGAQEAGYGGLDLAWLLLTHYARLVPILFTTFTPLAMAIAAMFAVARLQHANEVVPMLFVGRSIRVVLRPVLYVGVAAGLGMAACWQWVVPVAGAGLLTDRAVLDRNEAVVKSLVYEVTGDVSQYLYVAEYAPTAQTMRGVNLLTQGVLAGDASLVVAATGVWDPELGDWRLTGGRLTRGREGEAVSRLGRPDVTPEVLLQAGRDTLDPDALSYTDLLDLERTRPNRPDVKYALHRHITFPLANVILLLLVLPLAVYYERGSRIERVLGAIGLCGGYLLLDLTCRSLSLSLVDPVVAAWIPTIFFGSLGAVLYGSMRT